MLGAEYLGSGLHAISGKLASECIVQALYCVPGDLKRGTLGNEHVIAVCSSGTARDCSAVCVHGWLIYKLWPIYLKWLGLEWFEPLTLIVVPNNPLATTFLLCRTKIKVEKA